MRAITTFKSTLKKLKEFGQQLAEAEKHLASSQQKHETLVDEEKEML